MLLVLLFLPCAADALTFEQGMTLIRENDQQQLEIRSHNLTASLRKQLALDDEQTRSVTRIVLEISARAEAGRCRLCEAEPVRDLLCRMDRSIEKLLSTPQRARYQLIKRARAEKLELSD